MDRSTKLHRRMIANYGGAFTERYAQFIDDFINANPGLNRKQAAKHPDVKGSYAWNKRRTLARIYETLDRAKREASGRDIASWDNPRRIRLVWNIVQNQLSELRGKTGAYKTLKQPDLSLIEGVEYEGEEGEEGENPYISERRDMPAAKRPKTRRPRAPRASRPPVAIPSTSTSTSTSEPIVIEGRTPKDIHTQFVRHYMLSNGIRNWIDGLTGAAPSWAQFKADHNIVKRRVR